MVVIGFIEFFISLYIGINWGCTHATSPGGKAIMSIIGVVVLLMACGVINRLIAWVANTLDDNQRRRNYGAITRSPVAPANDREKDALIENLAARMKGANDPNYEPPPALLSREDEAAAYRERLAKAAEAKPLRWS